MKTREELIEKRNLLKKQEIEQKKLEKKFLISLNKSIGKECFKNERTSFGEKIQDLLVVIDNKIWSMGEKNILFYNDGYDKTLKVYFEIEDLKINKNGLKESIEKSIGFSSLEEFRSTVSTSTKITADVPKGCRFKLGDEVVHSYDDEFNIIFKEDYDKGDTYNYSEKKSEKWQEDFDEVRTRSTYTKGGGMEVIGFVGEKILLRHDDYGKFSLASDSDLISQQEINDIIFRSFKNVEEDNSKENKGYPKYKILGIDDNGQYLKYTSSYHGTNVVDVKISKG